MDVVGSGANISIVSERVAFVSKGILHVGRQHVNNRPQDLRSLTVGIEILNAHASYGKKYRRKAEWGFGKRKTKWMKARQHYVI